VKVVETMLAQAIQQGRLGWKFEPRFRSDDSDEDIRAALGPHNAGVILVRIDDVCSGALLKSQCEECLQSQVTFTAASGVSLVAQASGTKSVISQSATRVRVTLHHGKSVCEERKAKQLRLRELIRMCERQQANMLAGRDAFDDGVAEEGLTARAFR
jgi:ribosomal protein S27E